jgi:hypothetical protein
MDVVYARQELQSTFQITYTCIDAVYCLFKRLGGRKGCRPHPT